MKKSHILLHLFGIGIYLYLEIKCMFNSSTSCEYFEIIYNNIIIINRSSSSSSSSVYQRFCVIILNHYRNEIKSNEN